MNSTKLIDFFESLYKLTKGMTENTIDYLTFLKNKNFSLNENSQEEKETPNKELRRKVIECDERLSEIKNSIDQKEKKVGVKLKIIHEMQQMFVDINASLNTYSNENKLKSDTNLSHDGTIFGLNRICNLAKSNCENEDEEILDVGPLIIPHEVKNSEDSNDEIKSKRGKYDDSDEDEDENEDDNFDSPGLH